MNVILNVDEVQAIVALVSAQVLDNVDLSSEAKEAIRAWRREHDLGTKGLDEYAERFNGALGTSIDEQTTRYLRRRGSMRVSAREERVG
ncbi:MAG: hypothetical protein IT299_11855 [Dehalococcoidia bacterium]|nr:hypothetical protein [Dehalococcoidia bacterium]